MFQIPPDEATVIQVARREGRFRLGAYEFVREAVFYASRVVYATGTHVSGQQLLEAVRRLARERFGALAREVFEDWGVRRTEDVGEIVFHLVDAGILSKTDEDSREDFRDVYDLDAVFATDDYWLERFAPSPGTDETRPAGSAHS
jgi:uncharacterized repeat protein (TIGR04138 family)